MAFVFFIFAYFVNASVYTFLHGNEMKFPGIFEKKRRKKQQLKKKDIVFISIESVDSYAYTESR